MKCASTYYFHTGGSTFLAL